MIYLVFVCCGAFGGRGNNVILKVWRVLYIAYLCSLVSSLYSWDSKECNPCLDQWLDKLDLFVTHGNVWGHFVMGLFFCEGVAFLLCLVRDDPRRED